MSNPIERDGILNRLDRSKCVFPASSKTPTANGRGSIKFQLQPQRNDSVTENTSVTLPSKVKAAWALTLPCFIVADIFCFKYNGPIDVDEASSRDGRSIEALYITRLDRSEPVKSFLGRIEKNQKLSNAASDPAGHDIHVVEGQSSRHQCNTAIFYGAGAKEQTGIDSNGFIQPETDLRIIVTSPTHLELDYDLAHTSEDMAGSVIRTFQHIFAQISNPAEELLLQNVDLCPSFDRKTIQELTSNVSPLKQTCLHDLIIEQCRKRPDQIAIQSWDGDLTYRELDDLSLRLAHSLVELGVRPEVFVLSCFEKSTWAIVARLAILRAGGAYISIHASNPPVYLQSVITRTKTTIMLTDSYFVEQFRNVVPTLVELSPEWIRNLPKGTNSAVCSDVRPDNACLVLFTSGSTGTPKGIIQIHSSYATAIEDYARNLQMASHTRFLQFDDYAFDISNLEFLVPLVLGGVCCVPGPMKTYEDLTAEIVRLNANTIFLTPTVAIKLEPNAVPCLQTLCVGGEPLPKDLVSKWESHSTRLINQYGMGEVAICCAFNDHIDSREGARIGSPSTGAIWIVDPSSPEKLMPLGAVGELIIEGPHLSRGYIDSTALRRTEAGFLKMIPKWLSELHPDRASYRMYRSGDLGRRNEDGTITYMGRKDTILKLDGCRIDALEVEHQARQFLAAEDTIIVDLLGIINGGADPSLTAFVYLNSHPSSSTPASKDDIPYMCDAEEDKWAMDKVEDIKKGIEMGLPKYMIPTTWVLVGWVPRTASKKIDRKKMHVLGQSFYFSLLEERTKDISYAQKMRTLPM